MGDIKPKRKRTKFSKEQEDILETFYQQTSWMIKEDYIAIAKETRLPSKVVKGWVNNRRRKDIVLGIRQPKRPKPVENSNENSSYVNSTVIEADKNESVINISWSFDPDTNRVKLDWNVNQEEVPAPHNDKFQYCDLSSEQATTTAKSEIQSPRGPDDDLEAVLFDEAVSSLLGEIEKRQNNKKSKKRKRSKVAEFHSNMGINISANLVSVAPDLKAIPHQKKKKKIKKENRNSNDEEANRGADCLPQGGKAPQITDDYLFEILESILDLDEEYKERSGQIVTSRTQSDSIEICEADSTISHMKSEQLNSKLQMNFASEATTRSNDGNHATSSMGADNMSGTLPMHYQYSTGTPTTNNFNYYDTNKLWKEHSSNHHQSPECRQMTHPNVPGNAYLSRTSANLHPYQTSRPLAGEDTAWVCSYDSSYKRSDTKSFYHRQSPCNPGLYSHKTWLPSPLNSPVNSYEESSSPHFFSYENSRTNYSTTTFQDNYRGSYNLLSCHNGNFSGMASRFFIDGHQNTYATLQNNFHQPPSFDGTDSRQEYTNQSISGFNNNNHWNGNQF